MSLHLSKAASTCPTRHAAPSSTRRLRVRSGLSARTRRERAEVLGPGRKLSRDPAGEFANGFGGAQDASLYGYVGNRPIGEVDPYGLGATLEEDVGQLAVDAAASGDIAVVEQVITLPKPAPPSDPAWLLPIAGAIASVCEWLMSPKKPTWNDCANAASGPEILWEQFCDKIPNYTLRGKCKDENGQSAQRKRGFCDQRFR